MHGCATLTLGPSSWLRVLPVALGWNSQSRCEYHFRANIGASAKLWYLSSRSFVRVPLQLLERTSGTVVACCRQPRSAMALAALAGSSVGRRLKLRQLDVADQGSVENLAAGLKEDHARVDLVSRWATIDSSTVSAASVSSLARPSSNHTSFFGILLCCCG